MDIIRILPTIRIERPVRMTGHTFSVEGDDVMPK